MKITVNLPDKTEALLKVNNLAIDDNGNITGETQKVLKDDTTGEEVNDGDPQPLNLTPDQSQAILDAIVAAIASGFTAGSKG